MWASINCRENAVNISQLRLRLLDTVANKFFAHLDGLRQCGRLKKKKRKEISIRGCSRFKLSGDTRKCSREEGDRFNLTLMEFSVPFLSYDTLIFFRVTILFGDKRRSASHFEG